jgi:hypothetical protein
MKATINTKLSFMNRLPWLLCSAVLLTSSSLLSAQRRGGQNAGMGRTSPTGATGTDDLSDFKRALALQASPDQVSQYKRLTNSTAAARKSSQELLQLVDHASKAELLRSAKPFGDWLAEAQGNNEKFLQTFSPAQKSGLKDATKKLGKANSEVTRGNKTLVRELEQSSAGGQQIAGVVEKLDKALDDFQAQQLAIGNEMGIQSQDKDSAQ